MGLKESMGNREASKDARRYTKYAWWFVAAFLLTFPLSAIVSEGILVTMGYPSANFAHKPAPDNVQYLSNIIAMVTFALPTIGVIKFSRAARKAGDDTAWVVLIVGLIIGIGLPIVLLTRLWITLSAN